MMETKTRNMILGAVGGAVILIVAGVLLFRGEPEIVADTTVEVARKESRQGVVTLSSGDSVEVDEEPVPTPTPRIQEAINATPTPSPDEVAMAGSSKPFIPEPTVMPIHIEKQLQQTSELSGPEIMVNGKKVRLPAPDRILDNELGMAGSTNYRYRAGFNTDTTDSSETGGAGSGDNGLDDFEDETEPDDDEGNATPTPTPQYSPTPSPTPESGVASVRLSPGNVEIQQGETVTLDLYIQASQKPVSGYNVLLDFNQLNLQVVEVLEGADQYLGYPYILKVENDFGLVTLSSFQGQSLTEPTGSIHVASIIFRGEAPSDSSVAITAAEVANTDAAFFKLQGTQGSRIKVSAADSTPQ